MVNVGGALHYKGKTLPPVVCNKTRIKVINDGFIDILGVLNTRLEGPDQKSLIPVERAESAFLFLAGQDDRNWNRRSPRSSVTQGRDTNLSLLPSPCVGHPCTPWRAVLSSGEGSPGLMPWPRWMLRSSSRFSSTNTCVGKRGQSHQNCSLLFNCVASLMLICPENSCRN